MPDRARSKDVKKQSVNCSLRIISLTEQGQTCRAICQKLLRPSAFILFPPLDRACPFSISVKSIEDSIEAEREARNGTTRRTGTGIRIRGDFSQLPRRYGREAG